MLKSTDAPNDEERKVQVAENWNKLCSLVPPKLNLDGWIMKMQVCYAEAKEVGCQEFEQNERIIIQFLRAVGSTSPEFYGIWMDRIHDPDGRALPDFPDIINRYSQQVGVAAPRYQHRLAHAATFQGREPDANNKRKSTCPYENAEKGFKRATKSKAFKTAYTKALEKFKKDSSSSSSESPASEKKSRTAAFSTYIPKTVISEITRVALNTMQKKDTAKAAKYDIWYYDTGASVHICNDKSLLSAYRPATGSVRVGDTETNILGFGTLKVMPTESIDGIPLALKKVAFAPRFRMNLISADRAEEGGLFYDGLSHSLIESDKTPDIAPIEDFGKLALSSYKAKHQRGSSDLWHRCLGHVGTEVIKHLRDNSSNITVGDADSNDICELCKVTKAHKQISRKPMAYDKPFEALHWDLIHHEPSLAKTRYFSHLIFSDWINRIFEWLVLTDVIRLDIRTIHSDNETALVSTISSEAQARGINFETAPSHQPEQNGYAERYGALITSMARQLTEDAGLPHSLWHEASMAAIYIQNRIPHHALDWKSPSEVLASHLGEKAPHWLQLKPDLSNLRVYGCKAFVRTHNIPRLAKLAPRAEIGYLVGYEASNIWRIWIPAKKRIIRARDVEFDETKFYKGEEEHSPIKLYDDSSKLISTLDDYTSSRIIDDIDIPDITEEPSTEHLPDTSLDPSQTGQGGGMGLIDQPVPIPEEIHTAEDLVDQPVPVQPVPVQPVPVPEETQPAQDLVLGDIPPSPPLEPECVSGPQSDVDDLFPTSPVLGKRSRSPSPSPGLDEKRPRINLTAFYQAFSSNRIMPKKHMVSSIPPPPGDFSQVKSHPFRREFLQAMDVEFLQAMDVEFNKLVQMGTFEPIPSSRIRESHVRDCGDLNQKHCIKHQVLPLKWAYDCKSDEKGIQTP
ncbi:uncharacterized protein N7515_001874 [Penicillium bovifimosum]|uniref:Integrase catalytic domain-containing protein n=1 Tax=Penicillium bovifimosum TaxID=126998 RepID=A0A9W9L969_9EURO|nr:uncharacterized protein N7515_001874 [Penicillium bovifimosum]KAJ5143087.1 hypothetical protein N7515_001874 [Penicillium bovifimosum]